MYLPFEIIKGKYESIIRLIGGITAAGESFFETASAPAGISIVAAMAILVTAIAYICDKKKVIIKI